MTGVASKGLPATSYLVIVSPDYGGAERRFLDIFLAMRAMGHKVAFVAPSLLLGKFTEDGLLDPKGRSDVIGIDLDHWDSYLFVRRWRAVLRLLPRGSSFHYPMNCLWPLHLFRRDRVTMSITDCVCPPALQLKSRTSLWTWISLNATKQVDVLSPAIFKRVREMNPRARLSLTPGGTFIGNFPIAQVPREPLVGFLGRLVPLKGIDHWLDVLPAVRSRLVAMGRSDIGFALAGYGPLESHVRERVKQLREEGIPVEFVTAVPSTEFLPKTAVTVSMQEVTNYPSRVVAEALIAGNAVLVRDTGDSRNFGTVDGLEYCDANLNPEALADRIRLLVSEVMTVPGRAEEISVGAKAHFGADATISYFASLFKSYIQNDCID